MSNTNVSESNINEDYVCSREEQRQRYPSTNSSTPNSSGGDKQFHLTNNTNERSGQNSRTSSLAESSTASSTLINNEGFSNIEEIIHHLQRVWSDHNNQEGSRRAPNASTTTSTNHANMSETGPSHHPKGHSQTMSSNQQHYNHHQSGQQHNQYSGQQYWNNYNNPRRSGSGNYTRNYSGGNNDLYWSQKSNRFPSHRSMNNLMPNSVNYQQQSQSSPPTQRRQGEQQSQQQQQQQQYYHNEQQQQQQPQQSYFKKNRSDHRPNGYATQQQSLDYSSNTATSEQSNINSTQSYPSNLNSYNR